MSSDTIHPLTKLADVMRHLRDPDSGCPWDLKQNFSTIAPYTIEEAYEVADAIERNDLVSLKDELGDLLLQVIYHSQIASEIGAFTLEDVIIGITEKMIRRHPHVFGDGATSGWETIKAEERAASAQHGALDGVAKALPALKRAEKLQKRAARVGFDWPDVEGPRAKIIEEMDEVQRASSDMDRTEEFGDLLFAAVNFARHLGIDPEAALRAGNEKFSRRFAAMEHAAGGSFASLSLVEKDLLWDEVKLAEGRNK